MTKWIRQRSPAEKRERLNNIPLTLTFWETCSGCQSEAISEQLTWLELTSQLGAPGRKDDAWTKRWWSPTKHEIDADGGHTLVGVSCLVLDVQDVSASDVADLKSDEYGLGAFAWYMHTLPADASKTDKLRFIFPFAFPAKPDEAAVAVRFFANELVEYVSPSFRKVTQDSFDISRILKWPGESEMRKHPHVANFGMPLSPDLLCEVGDA